MKFTRPSAALLLCCLLYIACNTNQKTGSTSSDTTMITDSSQNIASQTDTLCFRNLGGTKNQDTTYLKFIVQSDRVTGSMSWMPYEKDARRGTITGTKTGETINAVWNFMQEGVTDSVKVSFSMSGNKLMQQEFTTDTATGRQVLTADAPYSIQYTQIDCTEYTESSF